MFRVPHHLRSGWPWLIGGAVIAATLTACGGGGSSASTGTL